MTTLGIVSVSCLCCISVYAVEILDQKSIADGDSRVQQQLLLADFITVMDITSENAGVHASICNVYRKSKWGECAEKVVLPADAGPITDGRYLVFGEPSPNKSGPMSGVRANLLLRLSEPDQLPGQIDKILSYIEMKKRASAPSLSARVTINPKLTEEEFTTPQPQELLPSNRPFQMRLEIQNNTEKPVLLCEQALRESVAIVDKLSTHPVRLDLNRCVRRTSGNGSMVMGPFEMADPAKTPIIWIEIPVGGTFDLSLFTESDDVLPRLMPGAHEYYAVLLLKQAADSKTGVWARSELAKKMISYDIVSEKCEIKVGDAKE